MDNEWIFLQEIGKNIPKDKNCAKCGKAMIDLSKTGLKYPELCTDCFTQKMLDGG